MPTAALCCPLTRTIIAAAPVARPIRLYPNGPGHWSRRNNGTSQWTAERSSSHERRHRGKGHVQLFCFRPHSCPLA